MGLHSLVDISDRVLSTVVGYTLRVGKIFSTVRPLLTWKPCLRLFWEMYSLGDDGLFGCGM
jgi:hypothetical protein